MLNVFVYGTLKPGEAYYETFCAPHVVEDLPALTQGTLFHLPQGFPALMVEGNPIAPPDVRDRWVTGVLLRFREAGAIAQIDAFEDYNPSPTATDNLYTRQLRPVFSVERQPLGTAWMYVMAPERVQRHNGIPIPSGVWSRQQWPSIAPNP